ncbi:MAG: GntR family transcriptional regulator [Lachnospiraceae bacterium]|nr:GntR family transcriptional regulator [Lachnospiraceae bacterium]
MLEGSAATPLYVQLSNEIEDKIARMEYKPGGRLLPELEMARVYGISVITVRKAINGLVEKGFVERRQGKGTFVAKPKYSRNMKKLQSFSEMCFQMGVRPGAKVLEERLVSADENVAKRLGIQVGSRVVYISRLRLADEEPVQIEKSFFPLKYAFLLNAEFDDNSLFDYLREQCGAKVCSSEKEIELCRATPEEAELLRVKRGDYLLFIRSTAYDKDGEPFYAGVQIINGDRFSLYVYESAE